MPQSVPSLPRRVARVPRTSLFAQVACALVLGIVVGKLWPAECAKKVLDGEIAFVADDVPEAEPVVGTRPTSKEPAPEAG
ncbi:hypothetical protein AB0L75_10780 [Streptomyces sp. NPDC052101]|uniref:hypothetical protein n=1 Tax=Streptomyces sp. NPDC052101 TaxID=3155763 RepID=UPI00342108DF